MNRNTFRRADILQHDFVECAEIFNLLQIHSVSSEKLNINPEVKITKNEYCCAYLVTTMFVFIVVYVIFVMFHSYLFRILWNVVQSNINLFSWLKINTNKRACESYDGRLCYCVLPLFTVIIMKKNVCFYNGSLTVNHCSMNAQQGRLKKRDAEKTNLAETINCDSAR